MQYAGLIKNDFSAAPGVSVSFYTQGCPHRCQGCHNPETWDFKGGKEFTANIFVIAKSNQSKPIDYSLYKYDQSLKRCYNECPNCKKIRELCIFYYENNSMKNGYVCTTCGKFFTN